MMKSLLVLCLLLTSSILSCADPANKQKESPVPSGAEGSQAGSYGTEMTGEPLPMANNEQTIQVKLKTQLVEWGGDGKWHDMYKSDNGNYWVNYGDPYKLILTGKYSSVTVNIKSNSGEVVFSQSGIELLENKEFVVSGPKLIGESDSIYEVEISDGSKIIYRATLESVPGGE
jgi:hypothetical protein